MHIGDFSILRKYTALTWVSLEATEGKISFYDLSLLANCTGLERLSISGTRVTDISSLKYFPKFCSLDLRNLRLADFSPLSGALALMDLNLTDTSFSDLALLASLPALKKLNCNHTAVTSLAPLRLGFAAIEELDISECKIKCYAALFGLRKLVRVRADIFESQTVIDRVYRH